LLYLFCIAKKHLWAHVGQVRPLTLHRSFDMGHVRSSETMSASAFVHHCYNLGNLVKNIARLIHKVFLFCYLLGNAMESLTFSQCREGVTNFF